MSESATAAATGAVPPWSDADAATAAALSSLPTSFKASPPVATWCASTSAAAADGGPSLIVTVTAPPRAGPAAAAETPAAHFMTAASASPPVSGAAAGFTLFTRRHGEEFCSLAGLLAAYVGSGEVLTLELAGGSGGGVVAGRVLSVEPGLRGVTLDTAAGGASGGGSASSQPGRLGAAATLRRVPGSAVRLVHLPRGDPAMRRLAALVRERRGAATTTATKTIAGGPSAGGGGAAASGTKRQRVGSTGVAAGVS